VGHPAINIRAGVYFLVCTSVFTAAVFAGDKYREADFDG
jgi:hypothetical protein